MILNYNFVIVLGKGFIQALFDLPAYSSIISLCCSSRYSQYVRHQRLPQKGNIFPMTTGKSRYGEILLGRILQTIQQTCCLINIRWQRNSICQLSNLSTIDPIDPRKKETANCITILCIHNTCTANGCMRKAIFSQCTTGISRYGESARNTNYTVTKCHLFYLAYM